MNKRKGKRVKKVFVALFIFLLVVGVGSLVALYWGTHSIPVLQPKGMIASQERRLIVICSLLMLVVVIPVLILTFVFAWKYREGSRHAHYTPHWEHHYIAEMCWWGVPFVIIAILAVITWKTTHTLDPFAPIQTDQKELRIQAVALNWKWLFMYPDEGIATVNIVRFPEKTPIHFEITADAPMNSFWIPQLGGQIYAMSGMRSELYLMADKVGKYTGRSANISGKGFSKMLFTAESLSPQGFDQWVEEVRGSQKVLTKESYRALAEPSEGDASSYYVLGDADLFDWIMMQYMAPTHKMRKEDATWKIN